MGLLVGSLNFNFDLMGEGGFRVLEKLSLIADNLAPTGRGHFKHATNTINTGYGSLGVHSIDQSKFQ